MKHQLNALAAILLLAGAPALYASDTFPTLKAGDEIFTNVTVTTVTATDIYFSHAKGLGNVKLKSLEPELQKRFKFDAEKGSAAEKQQAIATGKFNKEFTARMAVARPSPEEEGITEEDGDPVVTKLYARSFRGQRPPQIILPEWLTPPPEVAGKFVLVVFWTTSCDPCRNLIPHLNQLQGRFRDDVQIIALSDEAMDEMKKRPLPKIEFNLATDPEAKTQNALEVQGIPHSILIDPKQIVRFEGQPGYLTGSRLEHLIAKYAK